MDRRVLARASFSFRSLALFFCHSFSLFVLMDLC